MPTYRFQEVAHTERRRATCPGCGKRRGVQRTFTQTVNPFNTNADGTVKTYPEVYRAVREQGQAWTPSDREASHEACWGSA
jgi:hypothetical protein